MENVDHQESTTITFEWVLRGLKGLFDSSKGESKSKVTRSIRFGGGRWQILFYANSGTDGGAFISLYLSCEVSLDGLLSLNAWVREGVYKFSFELRSLGKTSLFNMKEANNHSFSWKTANWGWAQFSRRDHVYYHSGAVKEQDAFVIICTITSSPHPPVQPSSVPCQLAPKDLLSTFGSLLDDPAYSDVEFLLPRRGRYRGYRKIWGNRKILQRADYFDTMFNSGFAESSTDSLTLAVASQASPDIDEGCSDSTYLVHQFEDSDDEDEDDDILSDDRDETESDNNVEIHSLREKRSSSSVTALDVLNPLGQSTEDCSPERYDSRNVRAKLSHPSTPRGRGLALEKDDIDLKSAAEPFEANVTSTPKKLRVVVKDVAYRTYKAVLYYIYTDIIVFAPLSSSFYLTSKLGKRPVSPNPGHAPSESQSNLLDGQKGVQHGEASAVGPTSRREWIKRWSKNNPERPAPCSAKAVYRLADKLDLLELKERAFQHIQKSLIVENIPYEIFSPFSATFSDVRKVQVSFFLEHWSEIRTSEAMRVVWQQIRSGRHPGFEEVWPVIAQQLEFNPRSTLVAEGDSSDV
ncbi:hypothetical protein SERLA73DRAFT_109945 [Serpula lacrymans var. lacrymans S7.3]|uniref:MATH domain-containing protein n=1 Tax=Serpula lacrymans var. lacrymans (strain S7.3) TaxID=936435 RepID=F8PZX7_SERL3|nr:hypothetical protein SERLA73DRAFT_109945 [Serpula lacrymans var. lacrymans S7.3]